MKLFIFLMLICCAFVRGDYNVSPLCAKGPVHWCSNFSNAKNCNAVAHCIQTIWTMKHIPTFDNSSMCQVCDQMIKARTEQMIRQQNVYKMGTFFENSCKSIDNRFQQKQCIQLSLKYNSEILESLIGGVSTNLVCSLSGFCENVYENQDIRNYKELCPLCEFFLHLVKEKLSNSKNEIEIINVVSRTCNRMPRTIVFECHKFMDYYTEEIIELLIQDINLDLICPKINMCPVHGHTTTTVTPFHIKNSLGDEHPKCGLCLFAVAEAIELLKNDRSKEHIQKILGSLCNPLSSELRPQCLDFVAKYSKELIELLAINFITPEEICVYFKLCEDKRPDNSLIDWQAQRTYSTLDETKRVEPPVVCSLCTQILINVIKQIKDKNSDDQIKDALSHACDKQKKRKKECLQFITKENQTITDLIKQNFSGKEICKKINFCIRKH